VRLSQSALKAHGLTGGGAGARQRHSIRDAPLHHERTGPQPCLDVAGLLTKRVGLSLGNQDVYVNVAGGFTVGEPAVDLGVAAAVASSFRERRVAADTVLLGEVGLGGELRSATRVDARVREAAKLGFKRAVLPATRAHLDRDPSGVSGAGIELAHVATLAEALEIALDY